MPYPFAKNHPLDNLLLDRDNPRLPSDLPRSESSMIDYLVRNAAVEDLAESIGENGFFFAEALVAVPSNGGIAAESIDDKEHLIVVEGNRRLTALKVLQHPALVDRSALKRIAADAEHRPTSIPVIVYENREAVLQFLGYRHITGVRPWDPLAKARYIEQMYNRTDGRDYGQRYREVAQMVGSKPQYVRRSLNALAALNIAESDDYFGLDLTEEEIDFSVLLTALGYVEIQKFILNDPDNAQNTHLFENADRVNKSALRDLLSWMFVKGRNEVTRLVESRNLKKLAAIVSTEKALERFYAGSTIDQAYVSSKGSETEFSDFMQTAAAHLDEAAQLVAFVEYSDTLEEMSKRALVQAQHINRSMLSKKS